MRFMPNFSTFISSFMLKLSQFPGLGFLQNYVQTAKSMKYRFGDHAEDYEVYLNLGQEVIGDARTAAGGAPRKGNAAAGVGDVDNVYDDYEYDEENDASRNIYRPVDDYPVSDDTHSYYDDDYKSN